MEIGEALAIVLEESCGEDGFVETVRRGETTEPERTDRLLNAIEVIYRDLHGREVIDRKLANALFKISFHLHGEINKNLRRGVTPRQDASVDRMMRLLLSIQSVFEDQWVLDELRPSNLTS